MDATSGDVLETSPARPGWEGLGPEELRTLLDDVTVLPDEAANEARSSTDGPVTAIRLAERDGSAVWVVDIVSELAGEEITTHIVDARTGEVLERTEA
ncbi:MULTISPECIES: PepSY domain-containing protein [unclassified Streptomyces]|uniref:PepSY domain-containing protein n=1 Tax=unclassified Streptomyces TaxID=2593676 RepID=UPI0008DDD346|nr:MULTISPECIES: PepSY domain-containing protein [unclassified Streptomyces]OII67349.1 hypothetical protein BJP39_25170 [Streptomyces sp. CC77]